MSLGRRHPAAGAKTNSLGRVEFKLKPPKKGTIYIRATKAGYNTATATVTVRAR